MKYLKMVIFCLSLVLSGCFLSRPSVPPAQMTIKDAFGNTSIHYFLDKDDNSTQRGVRFVANQEFTVYVPLYDIRTIGMLRVKFDDSILTHFNTTIYMNIFVLKKSGTLKEYPVVEFSPKTLETIKGKLTNVAELLNVTSGKSVYKSKKKNIKKNLQYGVDALSQLELEQDDAIIIQVSRSVIDKEGQEKEFITPFPEKGFEDFTISSAEKPPIEEPISIITRLFKNITLSFQDQRISFNYYEMLDDVPSYSQPVIRDVLSSNKTLRWKDSLTSSNPWKGQMIVDFSNSVIKWGTDFDYIEVITIATGKTAGLITQTHSLRITVSSQYKINLDVGVPGTGSAEGSGVNLNVYNHNMRIFIQGVHKATGQTVQLSFNGDYGVKNDAYA